MEYPDFKDLSNATVIKLSDLKLKEKETMEMEYDYGSTTMFNITYLGSRKMKSYKEEYLYPMVVDGEGLGMLDDMSDIELKEVVEVTDKLGYPTYRFTSGYETAKKYDYRKYNIKKDNRELKGKILAIKNGYEVDDES